MDGSFEFRTLTLGVFHWVFWGLSTHRVHTKFRALPLRTRFLEKTKLSLKSIKILSRISKKLTDDFGQTIN